MTTPSELDVAYCFNLYFNLALRILTRITRNALPRAWEKLASYTEQFSPRDNVDYLTQHLNRNTLIVVLTRRGILQQADTFNADLLYNVYQSQIIVQKGIDMIEIDIEKLPLSAALRQMQQIWIALQPYLMLLVFTFFICNLSVSWIVHRLKRRNDNYNIIAANETNVRQTATYVTNGANNVRRRTVSRWSLLIDCLFRPLPFDTANSLMNFELDEDVQQLIERLALPNLWLTPTVPMDYLEYLPVWRFKGCRADESTSQGSPVTSYVEPVDNRHCVAEQLLNEDQPQSTMKWISSADCAICLDKYRFTIDVCGLPCGHQFHHHCILVWLQRDNHHCPICRWPAYQNKKFSI